MARYRHYDCSRMMMVPVSLEEHLQPGTLENMPSIMLLNKVLT
jgi:predicted RNA binding protein YcfA (HicA-like mRNA interferase family)